MMLKKLTIVKKVSKSIIYASFSLCLLYALTNFIVANQVGADEAKNIKTYEIANGYLFLGDPGESAVTKCADPSSGCTHVFKYEGECSLGKECYYVKIQSSYVGASIRPQSPEWILINEAKERASQRGDSEAVNIISNIATAYANSAFTYSTEVDLSKFYYDSSISITMPEFFSSALEGSTSYDETNFKVFKQEGGQSVAYFSLAKSYPDAKKDSGWLKTVKFLLSEYIPFWKNNGIMSLTGNSTDKKLREFLIYHSQLYLSQCDRINKNSDVISATSPSEIQLTDPDGGFPEPDDYKFDVNINSTNFPQPSSGYKTKVFVKPSAKSLSSDPFVYLGPYTEQNISFTFADIINSKYKIVTGNQETDFVPTNSDQKAIYNFQTPQKYILTVVTYENTSEKSRLSVEFQTVSTAMVINPVSPPEQSRRGSVPVDGWVVVTPQKSTAYQGEKVVVDIKVHNNQAKQIAKIAAYICKGDKSTVEASDSSVCTYYSKEGGASTSEDAIKARFLEKGKSGGDSHNYTSFTYDQSGEAKMSFEWDTSGSSIGEHAVMIKAFKDGAGGAYLSNSKRAETITVSNNSSEPLTFANSHLTGSKGGGSGGSILNMSLKASDNKEGSPIRSTGQMVTRILNIAYTALGGLAVIAIIIGGLQFISSAGNPDNATKGKKTVIYGVIGVVVAILAFVIEKSVIDIINRLSK